ncbi:MAG: hypothetical protein B6U72_04240 [Candidatus Altiarchaeales archaeon ex4484_2]|nr:MAG: hypothetical protein B6U72_04240 [Candidatus Altiarchaeales archaeon ex4484_2]
MNTHSIIFSLFLVLAVVFTILLFYFVTHLNSSKRVWKTKMFLNADPLIKSFYQLFMGAAFAYILFLLDFLNQTSIELCIIGELVLGFSLIGFAYPVTPLFSSKEK